MISIKLDIVFHNEYSNKILPRISKFNVLKYEFLTDLKALLANKLIVLEKSLFLQ